MIRLINFVVTANISSQSIVSILLYCWPNIIPAKASGVTYYYACFTGTGSKIGGDITGADPENNLTGFQFTHIIYIYVS